jgi:hypothetical protein
MSGIRRVSPSASTRHRSPVVFVDTREVDVLDLLVPNLLGLNVAEAAFDPLDETLGGRLLAEALAPCAAGPTHIARRSHQRTVSSTRDRNTERL